MFRRNRFGVGRKRGHRRALVPDGGDAEVGKSRQQARRVHVLMQVEEAGHGDASAGIEHLRGLARSAGRQNARDPAALDDHVTWLGDTASGSVDQSDVPDHQRMRHRHDKTERPAEHPFATVGPAKA